MDKSSIFSYAGVGCLHVTLDIGVYSESILYRVYIEPLYDKDAAVVIL